MHNSRNRLIDQLSKSEQSYIFKNARSIELRSEDALPLEIFGEFVVYFITSGSVALFVPNAKNDTTEGLAVGLIGNEGAIGLQFALGLGSGNMQYVVQSAGFAYAIGALKFQTLIKRNPQMLLTISRHLWTMYQDVSKFASISLTQDIKSRLIYWLQLSNLRCHPNELYMTHTFLSKMLGVRRSSITIAARELKLEGLIDYIRGHIRILDSKALDQILEFKVGSIQ